MSVCVAISDLTLAKMASHKKSAAAGQMFEELLRNTLRVLCSNAVPYGSQISIDAMVGITIDSSEVILVNVHEQLDKSGATEASSRGRSAFGPGSVKSEPFDGTTTGSLHHQHQNFTTTAADSSEYAVSGHAAYGSGAQAFSDVVDASEAAAHGDGLDYYESYDMDEEEYQDDDAAEFGDEYPNDFDMAGGDLADGGLYGSDVKPFSMLSSSSGGDYFQMSKPAALSSSRGRGKRGAAQMSGGLKKPSTPRRQTKASVKTEPGETTSNSAAVSAEKMTVYTCSVCGKMFRHQGSFQRHKQQHEGVVFRCDLCAAVLSRRDTLIAHRRKCEAKLTQQPSSAHFEAM